MARVLNRVAVWCARDEHSRCRSYWGEKPCRCKCHRGTPADPLAALDDLVIDRDDVLATAAAIMNGQPHELRVIGEDVRSGIFATPEELSEAAHAHDGADHVYLGLNPTSLKPHPVRPGSAVSDEQIIRVDWLGVDVDPVSDEDVFTVAVEINDYLTKAGFPDVGVFASSGRGVWLLWRIEQENTPEAANLRRRFLLGLKARWPQVDSSTYNASRVARFFGTVNLKNNNRSALYRVSETTPVPDELLERVAVMAFERPDHGVKGSVDVFLKALAERGITVTKERQLSRGVALQLSACPFYPEKAHDSAAVLCRWNDGNVAFRCLGDTCTAEDNRILNLAELLDIRMVRGTGLQLVRFIDIAPERVEFCWKHRIVLHDNNAIVGGEDAGKGCLMCRLAAELSTGRLLGRPVPVLYAALEERLAAIVRPRLELAGADLQMVLTPPMGSLNLPHGIPALMESVRETGVEFAFIDVVNKHFAECFDPLKSHDVGAVMGELAKAASEYKVTIVSSLHTNRDKSVDAAMRYAHSAEFRRSIRSSVLIGQAKGMDEGERLIVHDKHNYSVQDPALTATIIGREMMIDGASGSYPVLLLGEETDAYTTSELFLEQVDHDGAVAAAKKELSAKATVRQDILDRWERSGRPATMPAGEFDGLVEEHSEATVRRARGSLNIKTVEVRDPGTNEVERWDWHFPRVAPA